MRHALLVLVLAGAPALARADASINVMLNAQGQQLASDYGQSEDQVIQRVKDGIASYYETNNIAELLRGFADTAAADDRGIGVDYDLHPGDIVVGAEAHGALATDVTLDGSSHVVTGAVVGGTATAGWDLAKVGAPRVAVFANGFYEGATIHGLTGHLLSLGGHALVRVVTARGGGAVTWTGLAVMAGVEYARWSLGTSAPIISDTALTSASTGEVKEIAFIANGTLSLLSSTVSIPLEVTTGVKLFGVLVIYGGGGADLTFGSSTLTAGLSGDLTIDADRTPIGTATITASGSVSPTAVTAHALAGLQLTTRHVHVFVQGEITPQAETAALGVRGAF
ncbi:MAG TPA: hypothetical protein VLX92_28165 [Kofleriaceae bacterium]|nr:hypothetical protein [Kofleriaceae bacterium]